MSFSILSMTFVTPWPNILLILLGTVQVSDDKNTGQYKNTEDNKVGNRTVRLHSVSACYKEAKFRKKDIYICIIKHNKKLPSSSRDTFIHGLTCIDL